MTTEKKTKPTEFEQFVNSTGNLVRAHFREAFRNCTEEEQALFGLRLRKGEVDLLRFIREEVEKARKSEDRRGS